MTFEEAARNVYLNRSIAFFGAGFSRDATSISDEPVASTESLIQVLCDALGETESLPLDIAAQQYVNRKLEPDIRQLMQGVFSAKISLPFHDKIACLPWRRVYTTNYDNLIEFSRRKGGQAVTSPTALEKPKDYSGFFSVVHLHGFVERLTKTDWDEANVITDTQYASNILDGSGWLESFKSDASYADAVFFFGYSLSDLDITRLLYENPSIIEKTFIVIGDKPKRATEIRVLSYGTVVKKSVASAADIFPNPNDADVPKPSPFLATLVPYNPEPAVSPPSRDEVVSFLIKGDVSSPHISRDLITGEHSYFVSRDSFNSRADALGNNPLRLIIHGNLGNGKTAGLLEIAHYLRTASWRVLFSNGERDGFGADIDFISSLDSDEQRKTAIFFENAFSFSDEIRDILIRFPLLSVIGTTRTAALQTRIGDLQDAFGEDFELIDLNRLSDSEVADLDDILFENGLWGERQGESEAARHKVISVECRSDLATVLLDICRSSDIFSRIKTELASLDKRPKEIKKSIIAALCMTYAGIRLSVAQICDLVQSDIFKYGSTQRDPVVAEFMDFSKNIVTARSAIFAKSVLKDAIPDHVIIDTIPLIISRLDAIKGASTSYTDAKKQLMRFNFIEQILGEEQKEEKLVRFFEAIRASGVGIAEPQFWLQYAIACMSYQDYQNAHSHFQSAFGLAGRRRGYDPYQIENQYAKFLLESRSRTDIWDDYFDAFSEAHDIISRQMSNFTEGYYPYRVSRLYLDFVESKNSYLSRDQMLRISGCCDHLLGLSENAPADIKRSQYWRTSRESLKNAKDFIAESI